MTKTHEIAASPHLPLQTKSPDRRQRKLRGKAVSVNSLVSTFLKDWAAGKDPNMLEFLAQIPNAKDREVFSKCVTVGQLFRQVMM